MNDPVIDSFDSENEFILSFYALRKAAMPELTKKEIEDFLPHAENLSLIEIRHVPLDIMKEIGQLTYLNESEAIAFLLSCYQWWESCWDSCEKLPTCGLFKIKN